jgi:hypothetical protein
VGGIQAFFLPVWIILYLEHYKLVPMAIGILAGSHFLPYAWMYNSKTYVFLPIAMTIASLVFGYVYMEYAFTVLPFSMMVIYLISIFFLLMEIRR